MLRWDSQVRGLEEYPVHEKHVVNANSLPSPQSKQGLEAAVHEIGELQVPSGPAGHFAATDQIGIKICSLMCGSCESGFITPISVFLKIFFLYVYFWLRLAFVAVLGLSPVVVRGGFSLWWLLVWSTHFRECGLQ